MEAETLIAHLDQLSGETPDSKRRIGAFEPTEAIKLVPVDPIYPDNGALRISATLDIKYEAMLIDFLRVNADVFAWSPSDMLGISREVAEHALDIRAGSRPVKQRLRRFDEEKRRTISEEVQKLLATGFIKEVSHPEWLANPVLVKKKNRKWRMCVDYTGLNKACPKVPFPLP